MAAVAAMTSWTNWTPIALATPRPPEPVMATFTGSLGKCACTSRSRLASSPRTSALWRR